MKTIVLGYGYIGSITTFAEEIGINIAYEEDIKPKKIYEKLKIKPLEYIEFKENKRSVIPNGFYKKHKK